MDNEKWIISNIYSPNDVCLEKKMDVIMSVKYLKDVKSYLKTNVFRCFIGKEEQNECVYYANKTCPFYVNAPVRIRACLHYRNASTIKPNTTNPIYMTSNLS